MIQEFSTQPIIFDENIIEGLFLRGILYTFPKEIVEQLKKGNIEEILYFFRDTIPYGIILVICNIFGITVHEFRDIVSTEELLSWIYFRYGKIPTHNNVKDIVAYSIYEKILCLNTYIIIGDSYTGKKVKNM